MDVASSTRAGKSDCVSIKDTLGEIVHPEARLIKERSASRGDVAKSAGNNANLNLQKMMAEMSLQSLLKQVKDVVKPEQTKQLNTAP